MISKEEVFPIGEIIKPHGVKGEMSFLLKHPISDWEKIPFLIFSRDGILVPFFIENIRWKSDNGGFLKLEDINTETAAHEFSGLTIFLHKKFLNHVISLEEEELQAEYFIGFQVINQENVLIGTIQEVDQSTENILFVVEKEGQEYLIPLSEEYIKNIDHKKKEIFMELPEGLLDL